MRPHILLEALKNPENHIQRLPSRRHEGEVRSELIMLYELALGYSRPMWELTSNNGFDPISLLRRKEMTPEDFDKFIYITVLRLRNLDMTREDCTRTYELEEGQKDYIEYNSLYEFVDKNAIRKRLSAVLGYEPDLQHSYAAEMHMRRNYKDIEHRPNNVDYVAVTIVKFREVLFAEGLEAALNSPIAAKRWLYLKSPQSAE